MVIFLRFVLFLAVTCGLIYGGWLFSMVWTEIFDPSISHHFGLWLYMMGVPFLFGSLIFFAVYILVCVGIPMTPWYNGSVFSFLKKQELYTMGLYVLVFLLTLPLTELMPELVGVYRFYFYAGCLAITLVLLEVSMVGSFLRKITS